MPCFSWAKCMKAIQIEKIAKPSEALLCVEVEGPFAPQAEEVTYEITACPINPADLLFVEGGYGELPKPPCFMGAESVGRVTALGNNVKDLKIGDTVMHMGKGNWMQGKTVHRDALIKMPEDIDHLQLAMLKVNPPTAWLMLTRYVDLQPGEWLIQNAANSAVGHFIIRFAKELGYKTLNIVRREDVRESLMALGADAVLVDSPNLAQDIAELTGGAKIRLAIDAVAGEGVQSLADALTMGGTIVNYGLLSGKPCQLGPKELVFKDISLKGFWLLLHLQKMSPQDVQSLYTELADKIRRGVISSDVEATYSLEDIQQAVTHSASAGRNGKILLTPNGSLA